MSTANQGILLVCMGNICRSPTAEALLRAQLRGLSDADLTAYPEGCPYARLSLMVGQMRHLHTHMGMLMGFIIAARGEWPTVLGMKADLPTDDDGLPRYD